METLVSTDGRGNVTELRNGGRPNGPTKSSERFVEATIVMLIVPLMVAIATTLDTTEMLYQGGQSPLCVRRRRLTLKCERGCVFAADDVVITLVHREMWGSETRGAHLGAPRRP